MLELVVHPKTLSTTMSERNTTQKQEMASKYKMFLFVIFSHFYPHVMQECMTPPALGVESIDTRESAISRSVSCDGPRVPKSTAEAAGIGTRVVVAF